jgi:hypothetical protein
LDAGRGLLDGNVVGRCVATNRQLAVRSERNQDIPGQKRAVFELLNRRLEQLKAACSGGAFSSGPHGRYDSGKNKSADLNLGMVRPVVKMGQVQTAHNLSRA